MMMWFIFVVINGKSGQYKVTSIYGQDLRLSLKFTRAVIIALPNEYYGMHNAYTYFS